MSVHQQIRFSVKADAIDDVKKLITNYAKYVAGYAKDHNEEWTWATYQDAESPTDFVSVISHQDDAAEERHREVEGTKTFAENLYQHVTDSDVISFTRIATSITQ